MHFILGLVTQAIGQVWLALQHNWPYLLVSVLIAVLLQRTVSAEKVSAFLRRYNKAGVLAATTLAVATPLCSCGTTAVVLGMLATMMPWAPIVAFMVSSPLSSPEGLIYSAGLFGWPFAIAFFLASILLGLAGGWIAGFFESRGWLVNQTRFAAPTGSSCGCSGSPENQPTLNRIYSLEMTNSRLAGVDSGCGCGQPGTSYIRSQHEETSECVPPVPGCVCSAPVAEVNNTAPNASGLHFPSIQIPEALKDLYVTSKRLLTMFIGFAFLGYFLNGLIPARWVAGIFGNGHAYSVLLAATLGLPFYINSEASLPLVRALLEAGMSQGAAMAFLIAGAGTSIGAVGGMLTIARRRVVALAVGVLWAGAILCGYAYDLLLALGLH